jgi:hypothetical protein
MNTKTQVTDDTAPGTVVVRETGRGQFQRGVISGPHRLLADEPASVGRLDSGPGPYAFLLAALQHGIVRRSQTCLVHWFARSATSIRLLPNAMTAHRKSVIVANAANGNEWHWTNAHEQHCNHAVLRALSPAVTS